MQKQQLQGLNILNKYTIGPSLGAGAFGQVYMIYDEELEKLFALKRQDEKIKVPHLHNQYKLLKILNGNEGFPKTYYYGYQYRSNLCVMDLLGPSLQDLLKLCNHKFSLKTVLMLAQQIFDQIKLLHSKNYIYRDIKPENFVIGLYQKSHQLYMIDFGLCRKFKDDKNNQHIVYKEKKNMVGTVRYSSINSQLGLESSRRDDLQSIGYLLIYLATGTLPWKGLAIQNKTKRNQKILQLKMQTPVEIYTELLPVQFCTYLNYCKSLKFTEKPDYKFIKNLFSDLFNNLGFEFDYNYDWCQISASYGKNTNVEIKVHNGNQKENNLEQKSYVHPLKEEIIDEDGIQLEIKSKVQEQNNDSYQSGDENIDPSLLEDSELKLISHRSRWFDSYL